MRRFFFRHRDDSVVEWFQQQPTASSSFHFLRFIEALGTLQNQLSISNTRPTILFVEGAVFEKRKDSQNIIELRQGTWACS